MVGMELPDPEDFEALMESEAPFMVEGSVITEIPGSESSPFAGAPQSVTEAVSMVIDAASERCGEDGGLGNRIDDFSADVQSVEWDYYDSGWGGDDLSRLDMDYYPQEDLSRILGAIASEKGCTPSAVSDADFSDYVGGKRCDTHKSFRFDRMSGQESYSRSVTVE